MQAPDHSFTVMASSPGPSSQGECICALLAVSINPWAPANSRCPIQLLAILPTVAQGGGLPLHYPPWPLLTLRSKIKSLPALHWFPQSQPWLGWASVQGSASSSSQLCSPQPALWPAKLCSPTG